MTVTVSDIRLILNISEHYLSDEVIQKHIDDATEYYALRTDTSLPYTEKAILYRAARMCLLTYADIARRELGVIPPYFRELAEEYRRLEEEYAMLALGKAPKEREERRALASVVLTPSTDEEEYYT